MKECDLLDCGSLLPLWCGQPAAKPQAEQALEIQWSAPQQAVERKAAAGCTIPKKGKDRRDLALENLAVFVEYC